MTETETILTAEEQALADFIQDFWSVRERLPADCDVFDRLHMSGDDCSEFIEKFFEKYGIDPGNYLWYFHHGEEGHNLGGVFFKPPNARVAKIPITPAILAASIRNRRWAIEYPPHSLPPVRWDIKINQMMFYGSLALLVVWLWRRFAA